MPKMKPFNHTASATLSDKNSGEDVVNNVNAAAGLTLTLPAATGSGAVFNIRIGTTVTSNNVVIAVVGNDIMTGGVKMAQDAADTAVFFECAADSDTITLNGSTKGGLKGDWIKLIDVATDTWQVEATLAGTGTEATPFSAAVS